MKYKTKQWSETEQWVWEKIKAGDIANLNDHFKSSLDSGKQDDWALVADIRKISAGFLLQLLTDDTFQQQITTKGIRLEGALFEEDIDLEHFVIPFQLWFENCRFQGSLQLLNFTIHGWFSLENSCIEGNLDLNGALLNSFVSFNKIELSGTLDMLNSNVGASLDMQNCILKGEVLLSYVQVAKNLNLINAEAFKPFLLKSARVEGSLDLSNCLIHDLLDMNSIYVGTNLFLRQEENASDRAVFQGINLNYAEIGGVIEFTSARIDSNLEMGVVNIKNHLMMKDIKVGGELNLSYGSITGILELTGAQLDGACNCNSMQVNGNFFVNGKALLKQGFSMINTEIGGLVDMNDSEFSDKVNFNSAKIEGTLFAKNAKFTEIELVNAFVNGSLEIDQSIISIEANFNSLNVAQDLFLKNKASFPKLVLANSDVNGVIEIDYVTIEFINLNNINIGGNGYIRNCTIQEMQMNSGNVGGYFICNQNKISKSLDFHNSKFMDNLYLQGKELFGPIDLRDCRIAGGLVMEGSTCRSKINMDRTVIEKNLNMNAGIFEELNMRSGIINGNFIMDGSQFNGAVVITSSKIEGDLFIRNTAKLQDFNFVNGLVGGNFEIKSSEITGNMQMGSLAVQQNFFIYDHALLQGIVNLPTARVRGDFTFENSLALSYINMEGMEIGLTLFIKSCDIKYNINLSFIRVGESIDLSDSKFIEVNLTAANIQSELRLGRKNNTSWYPSGYLNLRNCRAGALQDVGDPSYPPKVELEGFTYHRLGGFAENQTHEMSNRTSRYYVNWLARDQSYSPQPYEYLADLFSQSGYPAKANDIQYASKERARKEAWRKDKNKKREWRRFLGLFLLKITIGYGLGRRYFWVLWWFLGFSVAGFIILVCAASKAEKDYFQLAWASFDFIMPLVTINDDYQKMIFGNYHNWVISYFYVQKLIGYILGGFLVAGLAGLTQKRG